VKQTLTLLSFAFLASSAPANVVDLSPQRGRMVPLIHWMDETGRTRQLSEFSGYPLILLPIYTRCPGPCLQTVDRLKEALADASDNPRQFRVLLFSFDPSDNAATLAKYRRRENIPLSWSIGAGSQNEIDALLESAGVQVGKAGTEFTHPNVLVVLDSKLRIAKWIYGTNYSSADVDLALKVAGGESDWIGQHSQLLYSLLLFAGSGLCVALSYHLMQLFAVRRSSRSASVIEPIATGR
jgi:cytochrome oxidase Cu insertion factor (SCO1/SenC/PrrC family)